MTTLIEKYSQQFKATATVREIAEYLIITETALTANKIADLVVNIKASHGLQCNCSGACISWYKNKMKTKSSDVKTKVDFQKYIQTISKKEQDKILLELATKHLDTLIKVAKVEDLKIPTTV